MDDQKKCGSVLGVPLEILRSHQATSRIVELARSTEGAYVCFVDAHMLVQAHDDVRVRNALDGASMRFADGTPVTWCLRLIDRSAQCVRGPEAMIALFDLAQSLGLSVGFYGGSPETLRLMLVRLNTTYPNLRVGYCYSPPFRALTDEERFGVVRAIRHSGVELLFVGLGCPKQELWMHRHCADLSCLQLGVGAAFRIFSGETRLPPTWVMNAGLTWLFRFAQEPRRLFRRIFGHLPRFVGMVLKDLLRNRAGWVKSHLFG